MSNSVEEDALETIYKIERDLVNMYHKIRSGTSRNEIITMIEKLTTTVKADRIDIDERYEAEYD